MREQLRALTRLAEIDEAARELDQELNDLPARIEALKQDAARLEGLLGKERGELEEAGELQQQFSQQYAKRNEALVKAKAKGIKARNAREVEASEREMEAVRRSMHESDEERKRLEVAIQEKTASLADRENKLAEFQQLLSEEKASATVRIEEVQAERAKVTGGRAQVITGLPDAIVRRYERVRKKHAVAVAEVIDSICMGCRLKIAPQQFISLQRGEEFEQCPHCLRLLYYREILDE